MTDVALTPEMGLAMLKQKRLLAIERRALADEEIRQVDAQMQGFQTALEMMAPKADAPGAPAGDTTP